MVVIRSSPAALLPLILLSDRGNFRFRRKSLSETARNAELFLVVEAFLGFQLICEGEGMLVTSSGPAAVRPSSHRMQRCSYINGTLSLFINKRQQL